MMITQEQLALIVALSTLGGALVASVASILTTWINKRSEERKQLQMIAVNAAIENWKTQIEALLALPIEKRGAVHWCVHSNR